MNKTKSLRSWIQVLKNIIAGIKDNQYWEQTDANKAYILVQLNVTANPYDLYYL